MDSKRQIIYWKESSLEDMSTARILIEKERFLHGLYFCHLAVEKILKALYVQVHSDFAPKTHNLLYLYEQCSLPPDEERKLFYAVLMKYQISGRYPDDTGCSLRHDSAREYLNKTEMELQWLMNRLEN